MNDPISKPSADQPDASRRRFAKAGLAAPVVLATLASKPVLGAVPWTCTISGQLSGNVSGHTAETCTSLAKAESKETLAGKYPNPPISPATPTMISGLFSGLEDYIFTDGVNLYSADPGGGGGAVAASINQILNLPTPSTFSLDPEIAYAQKAVVMLLNAKNIGDTSIYPLTEFQARNLYTSAAKTTAPAHPNFVDSNPNVSWAYDPDVKNYINLFF